MNQLTANEDARRIAQQVIRRDHRRIRALAIATVGLWLVAALLIPSIYLPFGAKVKHFAGQLDADIPAAERRGGTDPSRPAAPIPPVAAEDVPQVLARVQHQQWIIGQIAAYQWIVGAGILACALGAAILASAATVALALTLRRVTLRQVTESLGEMSEQLRLLRQERATGSA